MVELFTPENMIALATLTMLEIVLGIDNIIFISILVQRLPQSQQENARNIGLALAMLMRILLLLSISWVMSLEQTLFNLLDHDISGKDIILILGGLFLIFKSTVEIHHQMSDDSKTVDSSAASTFFGVLFQITLLDLVFSIDSVITAVGLVDEIPIMIIAIVIAVIVMIMLIKSVSKFVEKNPTIKVLALSFLLLIGMTLIADGLELHIPKGYIYFAMAFSIFVELINQRIRNRKEISSEKTA